MALGNTRVSSSYILATLPGPKGWRGFCVPTHWAHLQKPCQRAIPSYAPLLVGNLHGGVAGSPRRGGSGKPQVWSEGETSPFFLILSLLLLISEMQNGERVITDIVNSAEKEFLSQLRMCNGVIC